ncbi:vacuolar membrane protein [Halteromyces radiatus]|uniref:vacuolar membrane protein n=1 Tax=Halteromyces radiatus TaxID=101107 RepID=UPI00222117DD|nr:vacuolar membrane protein [Halteromyces radiatus]KAI8092862.1 vacuolar membrane protein [Halteromyces radiatus]
MSNHPIQHFKRRRYYFGILTLLVVVFIWVATSFVTNSIFGDQDFERPFFITYYSTSTFSVYLIPVAISYLRHSYHTQTTTIGENGFGDDSTVSILSNKMTLKETIQLSSYFCVLWFLANYCTNASLAYTTVGSSTLLSSMSGLFTLTFGVLLKVEKFNWIKIFSVGISFIGVILVSWSDQLATTSATSSQNNGMNHHNKLVGDFFALAGAMFYGGYTVLLKLRIGDESRIDMPTFFGFVGLFNVVMLWPFFFILHWTGVETFSFPYSSTLWTMISLNAFIGTFLSDYLWLLAMLMTSPLVVTLGITLTVPLALVGDVVLKHILPGVQYSIGACLVVAGFFAVNFGSLQDQENIKTDQEQETHEMIPCEEI